MIRRLLSILRPAPAAPAPSCPAPPKLVWAAPPADQDIAISRQEELALLRVEALYGMTIDREAYRRRKALDQEVVRQLRRLHPQDPEAMATDLENTLQQAKRRYNRRDYEALLTQAGPLIERLSLRSRGHLRVVDNLVDNQTSTT
ncbi:hypothetical protein ACFFMN_35385 [Planobispora siamensis]|uniref:Uncharacterized protein n=1 Tax=Planobispora siamensis TaxID=936338 RepID=A0A8J3SPC7_9ACTN|nr:hypothetical protein [Planobispora siamensis]GIH96990.1 hypothetical protein Psi01_76200 [Planobispora siamensis]